MAGISRKEYLEEYEPPKKKLFSDGDLLIKELAAKQKNTQINLLEQLTQGKEFHKCNEFQSVINFQSGKCSGEEFIELDKKVSKIEDLKQIGLNNQQIEMYFDYKKGMEFLMEKHKLCEKAMLIERLNVILNLIERNEIKPNFKTNPVHPMEDIKMLSKDLSRENNESANITGIRRKARKLARKLQNPDSVKVAQNNETGTKWDVMQKEIENRKIEIVEKKVYGCKPKTLYTVKDGKILKLNEIKTLEIGDRMNSQQILERFSNYKLEQVNKELYIKNLPGTLAEGDLKVIFKKYNIDDCLIFKPMSKRMRGQAFVTFPDEIRAAAALNELHGTSINGKLMIINYSRSNK